MIQKTDKVTKEEYIMTRAYSEAAVEVLDILNHTAIEKVKLIPTKFINYLKENAANDYKAELDYSKPINEMNIKIETKGILGTICRNWWWNVEQKQEYARLIKEKEVKQQEELREKYNPDVFKDVRAKKGQNIETIQQDNTADNTVSMVEYKESFVTKIINRIKSISFMKRIEL